MHGLDNPKNTGAYLNDVFSMIGTVFLFIYCEWRWAAGPRHVVLMWQHASCLPCCNSSAQHHTPYAPGAPLRSLPSRPRAASPTAPRPPSRTLKHVP